MTERRLRTRATGALAAAGLVSLAWATAVWAHGGVTLRVGGFVVSSNNPWRPLVWGLVAAGLAVALQGVSGTLRSIREFPQRTAPARWAVGLALLTAAVSASLNSWTASGPDSFAYVSQAALWRAGHLEIPVPLAADAPWPDAIGTFVPFGYRPAPGNAPALVPVTAPGLPLLMALAQTVAGHAAAFLITPASAALLLWLTFSIGRRISSAGTGLIAAWLVATSPALLFMLMWPMTDIPAAAIAALMAWCLVVGSARHAVFAGLVASAGIVTRPNFVAIAGAAGAWLLFDAVMWRRSTPREGWSRVAGFAGALVPGAVVMAAVNTRWYGAAFASGYGDAGGLIALDRITANAARYFGWLIGSSPIALVGLVALVWPGARLWTNAGGRRVQTLLLATSVGALSVYLVYGDFHDWWYLRFLLPAWPAIFIATSIALTAWARRGVTATIVVTAVVLASGIGGLIVARDRGVFTLGATERRYATIAHLVDVSTEPDAVILTVQHAGTVRYYAGRETLRFDSLDPAWLDRAIDWLTARGRRPYILIEDWEQPQFEARFASGNAAGRLSYSPVLAWQSVHTPGWVYLYDPGRPDAVTMHPGAEVERARPIAATPMERDR